MISRLATPDSLPWNKCRWRDTGTGSRGSYEIDRDRIIHSETFRELQYKTQVQSLNLVDGESDDETGNRPEATFRTRLNHVIEVAQVARSLAHALEVTESLAEAIALGHDLGHPPFGHAGERALAAVLRKHGQEGWNANVHSLAVVDKVERAFVAFRGLDLTWASREGIAKHSTPFDKPVSFGEFTVTANGGLECQIVDVSDVLAYLSHDLDDALAGDYVELVQLSNISPIMVELIEASYKKWEMRGKRIWPIEERDAVIRRGVVAQLLGLLIRDIVDTTKEKAAVSGIESPDDIRRASSRIVGQSEECSFLTQSLLDLLTRYYYRSDSVRGADKKAETIIQGLFVALLEGMNPIPERFHIEDSALRVATYLASLNDRSAKALAEELGVPSV